MRKWLLTAGTALGLACCTTNPTTGVTGLDVATIQNDAVAICSYLPTAATVASIVAANNPLVITAEAVAAAICNAVKPTAAVRRRAAALPVVIIPPTLQIQGSFVH